MKKWVLMSLFVCSTLCYAQEDDPFGLYKKGSSKSNNYDLEKVYEVNDRPNPFIGLNLGIGGNFGRGFSSLEGSLGLDIAGSINDKFAMGAYVSYQTITAVSLGLLFVHGNHNESHAFLWGIGYSTPELALRSKKHGIQLYRNTKSTPNFRFGFMLKNGLYFMTDMEVSYNAFHYDYDYDYSYNGFYSSYYFYNNYNDRYSFDVNFRIGYKF